MGMIITIEGVDRSGKSTQAAMLMRWMDKTGYKARLFEFPDYTTPVGRRILYHLRSGEDDPKTIHTLMAENRLERRDAILQAMSQTHVIVMNRYCESNIIYGMANGLDRKWLERLDYQMPKSDAVILVDVDAAEARSRRRDGDVFESDHAFMQQVVDGYRREAKMQRGWYVVPGGMDPAAVHNEVAYCATKAISVYENVSNNYDQIVK